MTVRTRQVSSASQCQGKNEERVTTEANIHNIRITKVGEREMSGRYPYAMRALRLDPGSNISIVKDKFHIWRNLNMDWMDTG